MPKRIQRSRAKGWRMPENTVYVGRPSAWGNPFQVGRLVSFRNDSPPHDVALFDCRDVEETVAAFRWLATQPNRREMIQRELRSKDLACWCSLDQPCHADVLLEIANGFICEDPKP